MTRNSLKELPMLDAGIICEKKKGKKLKQYINETKTQLFQIILKKKIMKMQPLQSPERYHPLSGFSWVMVFRRFVCGRRGEGELWRQSLYPMIFFPNPRTSVHLGESHSTPSQHLQSKSGKPSQHRESKGCARDECLVLDILLAEKKDGE